MRQVDSISGQELREMFATATQWLEKSVDDIDALNVFPVPDGDCGTNMLLTMRSSIEDAYRAPDRSASAVAQAMAKGALMGARGNSGVILSQIWRGMAESLAGKETFTGNDLANALLQASTTAYNGLSNPVEGTILTVIREASAAAQTQAASGDNDVISIMEATVSAANESVANTPNLLPVLKEAGVVDAGGQGLYTILEGALHYLKGETEKMQFRKPRVIASSIPLVAKPQMLEPEVPYGYCTNFVIRGQELNPDKLSRRLKKKGQSLIVVGDESTIRIHIHTLDPGNILHYAASLGTLHEINIRNMDEQYQEFLEMQKERAPAVDIATVAVVPGDGLSEVFASLGTAAIVPGGQTMNPSTKDLLQAVESVAADKVIILPNNKNIVLTAEQVQSLTSKSIKVIPTETIPQGIAALLAFDYEADFDTNAEIMKKAKSAVKSIEVTRAVRSTQLNGLKIKKKQAIGFLDGKLVAVGDSANDVLNQTLAKLNLDEVEVVTIYYGADTKPAEAEQISASIHRQHPQLQIEVVKGGQPHYNYIVSIE
ncbi:MAG: DAK2 domain-containing protein [Candidatus Methanomethylicota archaeon]|uniref:DAK2 domain-containing protein n=1 Tax=Thermoproteota archaeon TaxID=2056631 RepID=A0A497EK24_9CREN|nr:MAG: DAK2 domain-containing protein [Candidatus Verstraetearchaeota archaeon]